MYKSNKMCTGPVHWKLQNADKKKSKKPIRNGEMSHVHELEKSA